ncbi:hypothetical protein RFI_16182, partial [Reticulomyxa filosa]
MAPEVLIWKKSEGVKRFNRYMNKVNQLQRQILSSDVTTQVQVQLLDPGMNLLEAGPEEYPQWWNDQWRGHIDYRFIAPDKVDSREVIIFPNIIVPVCSTIVVNNDDDLVTGQIFRHDPPPFPHVKHFVHSWQESQQSIFGLDRAKRRYHLSACTMVYATGKQLRQVGFQVQQWIEYHRMQGFDHFFIYGHHPECKTDNISQTTLFRLLRSYIEQGL